MRMNIMTATSAENMKYFSITMVSLAQNNPNAKLYFYIVYYDINDACKKKIEETAHKINAEVSFVFFDTKLVDDFIYMKNSYPTIIMASSIPHLLLPEDIDRVIYFGTDVVVNDDISEFYQDDIGDYYFEGCRILSGFKKHYIEHDDESFDTRRISLDVMLVNLEKLRRARIDIRYYLDLFNSEKYHRYFTYANPEHLINIAFEGKIKYAWEPDYNYRMNYDSIFNLVEKDLGIVSKHKILHYIGYADRLIDKPWDGYIEDGEEKYYCAPNGWDGERISKETHKMNKIWWKYAEQTPFYDEMKDEALIRVKTLKSIYGKISANYFITKLEKEKDDMEKAYKLLYRLSLNETKKKFVLYLENNGIKRVGFYYNSLITRTCINILQDEAIDVVFIIQKGEEHCDGIEVIDPEQSFSGVDLIIIGYYNDDSSAVEGARENVRARTNNECKVMSIQEIVKAM